MGVIAPNALSARVRILVHTLGTRTASRQLGIAAGTLARVVGGLPVHPGTVALVGSRVDAAEAFVVESNAKAKKAAKAKKRHRNSPWQPLSPMTPNDYL